MEKQKTDVMYFVPLNEHHMYEQKIRPLLVQLAEEKITFNQLIFYLKEFKIFSTVRSFDHGHKHQKLQYRELQKLKFDIVPLFKQIAKFVLDQQKHFQTRKIKILLQGINEQIIFTKEQVIYLLCLMALNLVPPQQYETEYDYHQRKFPFIHDFQYIFSQEAYKTQTIIEYFIYHFKNQQWKKRQEKFIIKRLSVNSSLQNILKQLKQQKMSPFNIRSDTDSIQDFTGHGKVDFANKFVGGGVFHRGCVQEQIMFANHPQLFISVIFCEVMNQKESILLQGFRKYSKNKGYARTTRYDGQQKIDESTFQKEQYIIAIDALRFQHKGDMAQVYKSKIDRQILKAYAGFINLPKEVNVETGNWGSGAFSGDIRIKFLIQWIASSMAHKQMIYCPFGSRNLLEQNYKIFEILKSLDVIEVYQLLIKGTRQMKKMSENIFRHIDYLLHNS